MFNHLSEKFRRMHIKVHKAFGKNYEDSSLLLTIGDNNPDVASSITNAFSGVDAVEVIEGDLLQLSCDAIVSPANSFGDMGGGIDKAIDDFHKKTAQPAVMTAIEHSFLGELPVGMALVVPVNKGRLGILVVSPTMRVPGLIQNSINVYLSMRAVLVACIKYNAENKEKISSLAIPGLGTGVGGLDYDDAANQMRTAYNNVLADGWRTVKHPAMAPYALR